MALAAWGDTPATTPKTPTWTIAVESLKGDTQAAAQVPRILLGAWRDVATHKLSDAERQILLDRTWSATKADLGQRLTQARLDLDKKRLSGSLSPKDEASLVTVVHQAEVNEAAARKPDLSTVDESRPVEWVWPKGQSGEPWNWAPRDDWAQQSQAYYLVEGEVRRIADYYTVDLRLYSTLESRVLASWHGQLAHEEFQGRIPMAADVFREALLGRPWTSLSADGPPGTHVSVDGVTHALPWTDDELTPGPHRLQFSVPGLSSEETTVMLAPNEHRTVTAPPIPADAPRITIDTEPEGAYVYADSQYLGPAPQSILRPSGMVRVRVQATGRETRSVDVSPTSPDHLLVSLPEPHDAPSVQQKKDAFYWSLAVFSASLTTTAFLAAWSAEQVNLTNAYVLNGSVTGSQIAYSRYVQVTGLYASGVVLTSGLFVWMMVELADYLDAAQSTLP